MKSTDLIAPLGVQIPFALNGDKNIPDYSATGAQTSSLNLGFLPITQEPLDEGGIAPERIDFNGMFYLSTDQRVFLQNGGVITYSADVVSKIGGYPQNAILGYIDNTGRFGLVRSLVDDNAYNFVETPSYINGQYWEWVNLKNFDLLTPQFTTLQNNINTLNSQVVKLTGNQTITGTKTFSSAPKVPNSNTAGTALALAARGSNYIKFGDGTILQWGGNSGSRTITFPTPYQYTPEVMLTDTGTASERNLQKVTQKSTTNFTVLANDNTDAYNWFSIGR